MTALVSSDSRSSRDVRVAVIGAASASPVTELVKALPAPLGYAVIVVGHGSADLARTLRDATALPVVEVTRPLRIEAERVYIVPPGREARVARNELVVSDPAEAIAPVDGLLRSVADELGANGTGILLSGAGKDGLIGLKRLKEVGGLTIVQRPDVAIDGDVARAAIATGMIDLVVPLAEIGERLARFGRYEAGDTADADRSAESGADALRDVLALVRLRTGHDFSSYKRATLSRRLSRRMQVCGRDSVLSYHQFLRDHPQELAHLLRDFLISVTNFFRDRDAFDVLAATVIPRLFAGKGPSDQVRVWVAGCATGEEAYSIGILLREHAAQLAAPPQIQIFATDIDDHALAEARLGRYPPTIAADVSPERLARMFTAEADGYRVSDELREMVLFSPHNLLRDPPFSRLDLITCRNVLIYLNRDAQDRVLNVFHFGLRADGYLMLGSSESAENSGLFSSVDARQRIYAWRPSPARLPENTTVSPGRWALPMPVNPPARTDDRVAIGALHQQVVEEYAPPSVLVNDDLDIVHISEHAGRMLQQPGGEPTRQLLQLILPALRVDLRTAIYAARQNPRGSDTRVISYDDEGTRRAIELRVRTVNRPALGAGALLVMFDEVEPSLITARAADHGSAELDSVVHGLEGELGRTRDQLRVTIEQYETSLEELKASNEELQAINEELRSATEELETSREELQSVNEELITLNHELKLKVDEVSHTNSDLQNLILSTDIGVVFLDRELNIKRFTPRAQDLINVIPSDVGRPLSHLTHQLIADDLPQLAQGVLTTLRTVEREVGSRDGRRHLIRLLPYRSLEDRIDGVVLTLVEVTDLRNAVDARQRSEAALRASEERLRFALRNTPILVLTQDTQLRTTWGYVQGHEIAAGSATFDALFAPAEAARFAAIAQKVLVTGGSQQAELEVTIDGAPRVYDVRIEGDRRGISAVGFDITSSRTAEIALREADRRKDEFLATLAHELRNPLMPLKMALDVAKLAPDDPAQVTRSRGIMERQVAVLGELVDDLLDLSSIAQGKLHLTRVPLDPTLIVEAALETTRPLVLARRHELTVALPERAARVIGDQGRLTQVLTNLLTNAAKYTPDGGHIALTLEVDDGGNLLVIRVRDDGRGIAPDLLEHVFEVFVQSRDVTGRAQGGLGIGLAVVRKLTELHGGRVQAFSDGPGLGSEFVVALPLADEPKGTP